MIGGTFYNNILSIPSHLVMKVDVSKSDKQTIKAPII